LGLHKIILINNVGLSIAINHYVPILEATSGEDIVKGGWRHEPPKALSDIFESVMGAVLIDSAYNYERAASVVEFVMEDVLGALSPSLRKDPVSELLEWIAGRGCRRVMFR
jgi:endoribonuclease Dicer